MSWFGSIRIVLTAILALAIMLWAEAGLALVPGDQVMECAMTMHHGHAITPDEADSDAMPCCPGDHALAFAMQRPPCCSVSNGPERPLGFVVSSERTTTHPTDGVAYTPTGFVPQAAEHFGVWRNADAPRFVKPVLELKDRSQDLERGLAASARR